MVQEASTMIPDSLTKNLLPICFCKLDMALKWVASELNMQSRLAKDNESIEVMIADNCWMTTYYMYKYDYLLKKIT